MDNSRNAEERFKTGDYVTYRKNGVCLVSDITVQNFVGQGKNEYYVLNSVYDANMKVFVPIGSSLEQEMQYMLNVDEIHKIIEDSKKVDCTWIEDCKSRASYFETIINSGDRTKMLWLIRIVGEYKVEFEKSKKKMKATDLKYFAQAESIISADFAFPLALPKNEVMGYINNYLDCKR